MSLEIFAIFAIQKIITLIEKVEKNYGLLNNDVRNFLNAIG